MKPRIVTFVLSDRGLYELDHDPEPETKAPWRGLFLCALGILCIGGAALAVWGV